MKRLSNWAIIAMAAGCLALVDAGCKKQEQSSERKTQGVRVSVSELRQAFEASPDKDIKTWVSETEITLRSGQYANTLAVLDKLANHPSSTAAQKKVIGKVAGQVQELAAKSRAVPGN